MGAHETQANERTKLLAQEDAESTAVARKSSQARAKTAGLLVLLGTHGGAL